MIFQQTINSIKEVFSSSRLRKKFLGFFFAAGIVPLILMGLIGIYIIDRTNRIDVSAMEEQLANYKKTEIEKFISDVVGLFQLRVGYEQYAEIEISQQQFIADKMIEENSAIDEITFINVYGKETVKSFRDKTKETELSDQSGSQKFVDALRGEDYFGPISYSRSGLMVTVASPVYNQKNQIISVLTGEINLSGIQNLIFQTKIGNTGYVYLVDQNGTVVAHSKAFSIGNNLIAQKIVLDVLFGTKRTGLEANAIYRSLWGDRVIGSGSLIPKLNWGIIVEWPTNDAQAVVGFMATRILWFALGTLLLIFVLASLAAFKLIKPISALKEGAKVIGGGDFDYRLNIKTGDEIEDLGHSLNLMASSLKEIEELREVKIRAQYLAENLKKEQELSELKNQFITVASHQLNTPLTVINWSLEAMKDPKAKKQTIKDSVLAIDQSRRDILAIATDLLTLSEIGFRYQKKKTESVDLLQLTQNIIKKYDSQINAKNIKVEVLSKTKNTKANLDSWAINNTIENLLDNAICYGNDKSTINIEIGGVKESLTFKITDTGIGIPKDEQSKIFKEFFRAKNVTAKKNVGTGLGLFLAKSFIDGHDGEIGFKSEENKGTTFYFTIPRKS